MSSVHSGRCLCAAVTFELHGKPLWIAHCHCESCRRATGAALATFVGCIRDDVRFVTGSPREYASSTGVTRSFCDTCGTPLAYEADRYPGEIHLYVSTFDDPSAFPPTAHVHTAEQISWLHIDDGLKRFSGTGQDG